MRYRGIATLFCIIFDGIFADCRKVCIFADRKRRKCCNSSRKWSDGRVARQRSAKPRTAVRIRFRPHKTLLRSVFFLFAILGYLLVYLRTIYDDCGTSSMTTRHSLDVRIRFRPHKTSQLRCLFCLCRVIDTYTLKKVSKILGTLYLMKNLF